MDIKSKMLMSTILAGFMPNTNYRCNALEKSLYKDLDTSRPKFSKEELKHLKTLSGKAKKNYLKELRVKYEGNP